MCLEFAVGILAARKAVGAMVGKGRGGVHHGKAGSGEPPGDRARAQRKLSHKEPGPIFESTGRDAERLASVRKRQAKQMAQVQVSANSAAERGIGTAQ